MKAIRGGKRSGLCCYTIYLQCIAMSSSFSFRLKKEKLNDMQAFVLCDVIFIIIITTTSLLKSTSLKHFLLKLVFPCSI